jgi:hypothetical protein
MSKILVLYYSAYGHIEKMAEAVAEGARAVPGTEVIIKRVPELVSEEIAKKSGMKLDQPAPLATVDELPNYDAIIFGRGRPENDGIVVRQHVRANAQLPRPNRLALDEGRTGRKGRKRFRQHWHPTWRPGDHHHLVPQHAASPRNDHRRIALFLRRIDQDGRDYRRLALRRQYVGRCRRFASSERQRTRWRSLSGQSCCADHSEAGAQSLIRLRRGIGLKSPATGTVHSALPLGATLS